MSRRSLDTCSQFSQHLKTLKHSTRSKKPAKQPLLTSQSASSRCPVSSCEFADDLCPAFVGASIPLHKLESPTVASLLEKYTVR